MASQRLTQAQISELRDTFNMFDKDGSGSISSSELKKVCKSLNLHASDKDVQEMMKLMDKDRSGSIEFDEFVNVMAAQFYHKPSTAELNQAFDYFDKDGSGYITEDELFQAMTKFRGATTHQEISKMIRSLDKDSDGRINKKEFITLLMNN